MSTRQNEKEQKKISGKCEVRGKCLADQWLGCCDLTAEALGSAPAWGTEIPQAAWSSQCDVKKRRECFKMQLLLNGRQCGLPWWVRG